MGLTQIPGGYLKQLDGSYSRHGPPTSISTDRDFVGQEKRIRQNTKPLMNGLETKFYYEFLLGRYPPEKIQIQAITVRLANGLRYTPDFFTLSDLIAWEVKGKWVDGDSFPKLKMAATMFPEVRWWLAWKTENGWRRQDVLP
jgi:hypothetical protein